MSEAARLQTPQDFAAWRDAHERTLAELHAARMDRIQDRVVRVVKGEMRQGKGFDEACARTLLAMNYGHDGLTKSEVKQVLQALGWKSK